MVDSPTRLSSLRPVIGAVEQPVSASTSAMAQAMVNTSWTRSRVCLVIEGGYASPLLGAGGPGRSAAGAQRREQRLEVGADAAGGLPLAVDGLAEQRAGEGRVQ